MSSLGPILRTPDREERIAAWTQHERRLVAAAFGDEAWPVVEAFIDSLPWESDGQAALSAAASRALRSPDRGQLTPEESAADVAGRRTVASLTYFEHTTLMAERLGIRYEEMDVQRRRIEADFRAELDAAEPLAAVTGETALYRHFDESGRLLYVGIAESPTLRAEQHRARSPWWRFVVDTDIDWFVDRDSALRAERDAIQMEHPIFNETHNKANRDAAIAYLFASLDGAIA